RQDLDYVTVLDLSPQRNDAAVDLCPGAAVADNGVDRICEIDRRCAAWQLYDPAHRRKCIDSLGEKVESEGFDEILRILRDIAVLDQRQQEFFDRLSQLIQAVVLFPLAETALFVFPMRCNAF